MGRLLFHINSAYAEFEREIIRERVKAGIKAKREKTGTWGRKALANELRQKIKDMIAAKQTIRTVAQAGPTSRAGTRRKKIHKQPASEDVSCPVTAAKTPSCKVSLLRDGRKHGRMVGATPPTLHALPCEGVRRDTEGEHPNRDTGLLKANSKRKRFAGRRHRQNIMMEPKDEDFL